MSHIPHTERWTALGLALALVLLMLPAAAGAQDEAIDSTTITVAAHIEDATTGEALPYARVYVSAGRGTMSNDDGDFLIAVEPHEMLQITFIGYEKVTVRASELPHTVRMQRSSHTLGEVVVLDKDGILEGVAKRLERAYKRHKGEESRYFMRQTNVLNGRIQMVEAYIEALSAVNMRKIAFLSGRHFKDKEDSTAHEQADLMHFSNTQLLLCLAPLVKGTIEWEQRLIIPFNTLPGNARPAYKTSYRTRISQLKGDDGREVWCIHFEPLDEEVAAQAILCGTLYVDAKTLDPLKFDGKLSNLYMTSTTRSTTTEQLATSDILVQYDNARGFPQISHIATALHGKQVECRTMVYCTDGMQTALPKRSQRKDNMIEAIRRAGFDKRLWRDPIVRRTAQEEQLLQGRDQAEAARQRRARLGIAQPDALSAWTLRADSVAQAFPQEKVFVHLDNSSYFLGDTIHFKAYTRCTSTHRPSSISGVLYVDLLNHDGYLMERQTIRLSQGQGIGSIVLPTDSTMYAGFYELRAYTRWQLGWAQSELPHDKGSEYWFHNDKMAREYFRDYTKIYSRTFPVYDRPLTPGDYTRDMTLRRMMRQYPPADQEPQLVLTFYPEGGNMVQGVENAVAFEVATDEGEAVEGTLSVARTQVATVHRGRGAFEVTPGGEDIEALFTSVDGRQVRATLPRAQASGVALRVERQPDTTLVHVRMAGAAVHTPLAVAVMHQGEPTHYQALATGAPAQRIVLPHAHLTPGVQQITIYDTQGRVWADRLFFHRTSSMGTPSVQILDVANEYTPRQPITLRLRGLPGAILSVAVRDAYTSDATYDSGNIFTEMLLASEIKGFVPQPDWYFAKNDTLHRTALDLLMRTQGWRRYRWTDLAGGKWKPTEAAEPHMKLRGEVLTYAAQRRQETAQIEDAMRWEYDNLPPASTTKEAVANLMDAADAVRQSFGLSDGNERTQASQQYQAPPATTRVHMEYIQGQHGLEGFATRISNGVFEVSVPNFTGHSILHLAANDTAKWDKKKHTQKQWVMPTDEEYPEFCVRLCKPLPRHPQPYTFYHTHLPQANEEGNAPSPTLDGEHQLQQVSVHSRHGRLIRRMHVGPALRLDAYQAFNAAVDAGLLAPYYPGARAFADAVARCYVGDMGTNTRLQALLLPQIATSDASPRTAMAQMAVANSRAERRALAEQIAPSLVQRPKSADDNPSTTSGTTSHLPATQPMAHIAASMPQSATTHSQHQAELYHHLANLDSVYVYTDYAPRLRGDKRYLKPNVPEVAVYLKLLPEGKQRQTFRDRFIVMPGYATPHECYNPNYNQRTIRPRPADHRRTLYWHPAVALNEQGEATITLYNCSRTTRLAVEANGLTPQGVVLWGKE